MRRVLSLITIMLFLSHSWAEELIEFTLQGNSNWGMPDQEMNLETVIVGGRLYGVYFQNKTSRYRKFFYLTDLEKQATLLTKEQLNQSIQYFVRSDALFTLKLKDYHQFQHRRIYDFEIQFLRVISRGLLPSQYISMDFRLELDERSQGQLYFIKNEKSYCVDSLYITLRLVPTTLQDLTFFCNQEESLSLPTSRL